MPAPASRARNSTCASFLSFTSIPSNRACLPSSCFDLVQPLCFPLFTHSAMNAMAVSRAVFSTAFSTLASSRSQRQLATLTKPSSLLSCSVSFRSLHHIASHILHVQENQETETLFPLSQSRMNRVCNNSQAETIILYTMLPYGESKAEGARMTAPGNLASYPLFRRADQSSRLSVSATTPKRHSARKRMQLTAT